MDLGIRTPEETLGKKLDELTADDLIAFICQWKTCVTGLDKLLYEDARKEFNLSAMTGFGMDGDQQIKEQDFMKVRGTFENNRFVTEVVEHIRKKTNLPTKWSKRSGNLQALDSEGDAMAKIRMPCCTGPVEYKM